MMNHGSSSESCDSAQDLFARALDLPEQERAAFLNRACADNRGLRAQLDAMLAIEERRGDFMRDPTVDSRRQKQGLLGSMVVPYKLRQIKEATASVATDPGGCSEFERVLLKDLELAQRTMQRVMGKSQDPRIKSRAFYAQSHL